MASSTTAVAKVKILDQSQIAPPHGSAPPTTSLPLTFFDIIWLVFPPMKRLMFFEFHHAKQHFIDTVIPNIKHSLSLALQHFYPFAGHLRRSPDNNLIKPDIFFSDGDSVSLTVAESDSDFNHLTGHHPSDASEFKPFAPALVSKSSLMAAQVTLFPNSSSSSSGISIGITFNHVVADGKILNQFIKCWASICRFGSAEEKNPLVSESSLPLFLDRTIIKDPKEIYMIHLNQLYEFDKLLKPTQKIPNSHVPVAQIDGKVRAKFVMGKPQIEKLKQWVTKKINGSFHLSSFVIVCAYFWVCLTKSRKDEDERTGSKECFVFAVDCRDRLDPPIPKFYFGNCIVHCVAKAKKCDLIGEDGIVVAAKAIGTEVQRLNNRSRVMEIAETSLADLCSLLASEVKVLSVAGSPKFKVYEIDFGWGRPKKVEVASIEDSEAMSLFDSRDEENGGVEVGLVLSKLEMDAFASLFADTLKALA